MGNLMIACDICFEGHEVLDLTCWCTHMHLDIYSHFFEEIDSESLVLI